MDVDTWRNHFQRMAEGKIRPNHKGQYIVQRVQKGGRSGEPAINFVTPVAADIERAKSELSSTSPEKEGSRKRVPRKRTNTRENDFNIRPPGIPAYGKYKD